MTLTAGTLKQALQTLGELLDDRGHTAEVVAIGGGSLLLTGFIERPTKDLDLVAIVEDGEYASAKPLPDYLAVAAKDVAAVLGLADYWFNGGPTELLELGLPKGFASRVETRTYGALTIHIAGRFDQICFKLYAAVDQGPDSKHFADLERLQPSGKELQTARAWCVTHDVSPGFADQIDQAVAALGVQRE